MRAHFLNTLRQLALTAASIMMAGSALAHSSSNSYLTLSAPAQQLMLRADINLRDLDLIFDLDNNRDGRVTWGETQARSSELDAWLREGIALSASGNACKAYGVANIMRMPTRLKINWTADNVLKVETDAGKQVRNLTFTNVVIEQARREIGATGGGTPRPDAQGQQAENITVGTVAAAAPSLQGTSRAEWERSDLKVTTTNHAGGYLRRNGVPYSDKANITEYYYRYAAFGDEWLTVSTIVEDPQNLRQPFLTSSSFKKEANDSKWAPSDCVSEWGPLKQMGVDPFN